MYGMDGMDGEVWKVSTLHSRRVLEQRQRQPDDAAQGQIWSLDEKWNGGPGVADFAYYAIRL